MNVPMKNEERDERSDRLDRNDEIKIISNTTNYNFGGHPVWRKEHIVTVEQLKSNQREDDAQSLNTEQAMSELDRMLRQENRHSRSSYASDSSGSSGYSEKDAARMGMRDTHSRCSPVQEQKFRPEVPFHEEDLRPQPIQRKSRKVLVLEEDKDEKYWEKRRKNNAAAKRSREARRSRENQIAMRASYLEKDNQILKEELLSVKEELQAMREQLILAQQGRLPKRCELPE